MSLTLNIVSRTFIQPNSAFSDHASNASVDFGTGTGRAVICLGAVSSADATLAHAQPGWMRVGSTSGSGGTLMSKDAALDRATGSFVYSRLFYLDSAAVNAAGSGLTGTKEAWMAVTLPDDTTLDSNRKPGFLLLVVQAADGRDLTVGDLATATVSMSGSSCTQSVGSPGAEAVGVVLVHSDGAALATASAPNALLSTGGTDAGGNTLEAIQRPGTGSALTVAWTAGTANENQGRHILSLTAAAPAPALSSPTAGANGTTTTTISATTDRLSDGMVYFLRRVGGSAALDTAIVSTGESQAATGSNPQSRVMTGFTAGSANNYVDIVQAGAGGNSHVVTAGPITMASAVAVGSSSAQSGTQGSAFSNSGATPAAGTTGGFGSISYSLGAGSLPGGMSVNAATGVLQGTPSASGTFSGIQIRGTDSGSPASTALGAAFTLTVAASGGGDVTAPSITSTGTGSTNGPFAANVAENSTAAFITLTSDEALAGVTKGGADGALFTLAGSGLTRTLAPTSAFNYESLPHANPFVVTLDFADTAGTPNVRSVTVNVTVTNVNEPPSAPTIGAATAGDQTVNIAFTPPVNTGKPTITGYTATLSPGGITKTGVSSPISFGAGDGIVNGTAYSGVVKATNSEGTGPDSASSNSVTPAAAGAGATVTTPPLTDNTTGVWVFEPVEFLAAFDRSTLQLVALIEGGTTDGLGRVTATHASLVPDALYLWGYRLVNGATNLPELGAF